MAGFISRETIDQVTNSADIVSVVGDYVRLNRRGADWWGCCPFHNEKTASFHVVTDKNLYYCFGCHASGGSIKFIQEIEKISFPEAVIFLARRFGVPVVYSETSSSDNIKADDTKEKTIELYGRVSSSFHYFLTETEQGKKALEYIKNRGISDETIEKFRLGYAPADRKWLKQFLLKKNFSREFLEKSGLFSVKYSDISFFSDRLMFPIFDRRGNCVAFGGRILNPEGGDVKYLNSRDLPHYSKKEILYAFNFAKDSIRTLKTAVICEGYMDCIAYHQSGILNAVATCGTALTQEHLKLLRNFADTVLLSFDSDRAGQSATEKSILMCRKAGFTVKIVQLRGGKDPAEIMLSFGKNTLTADVNNAILDSDYLLENYAHKFPVDTPEGKSKASLAFFDYVDALQTDIQKESCLEQLCQKFNISMQSVVKDFKNRDQVRKRAYNSTAGKNESPEKQSVKLNAELRALFAVIADTNQFELMRRELNEDVFESAEARNLFVILEECYQKGDLSLNSVLSACNNEKLVNMIAASVASGEYSCNAQKVVSDSIMLIKKNCLERNREDIKKRIQILEKNPEKNREELEMLLTEKMNIDTELKQ